MDFQSNKINQPFNPSTIYLQGLSNNIQNRIGIEVKNVVEAQSPKIEPNIKQRPIQLTVEFGIPLTDEKNNTIESSQNNQLGPIETNNISDQFIDSPKKLVKDDEIGQIHIEPIFLAANPNPYWHNFNSDDVLEGLVLDSEGQEMSDITINGDAMFDIDQHFFQKANKDVVTASISEVGEESSVLNEGLTDVVYDTISTVNIDEIKSENNVHWDVNDVESTNNDIPTVLSCIQNEETFFSFTFTPEIAVEPIINEVEPIAIEPIINEVISEALNQLTDINIEIHSITENNRVIEYSFGDSEFDHLNEEISQQIEINHPAQKVEQNKKSEVPEIIFVEFSTNENTIQQGREFTDSELDLLHEQLSNETEASKSSVSEPIMNVKNEDKTNVKIDSPDTNYEIVYPNKTPMMELIPWSSVFGIIASLMAVAAAWFIWNSIQKPIAIDAFIESKIGPIDESNKSAQTDQIDKTLSLAPADFIANEILLEVENPSLVENNFNFVNLPYQSKCSAVLLENNGLTTLELENGFFEDFGI